MTVQAQDSVQYYRGPIAVGTVLPITEFTYADNSHISVKVRNNSEVWLYGVDYKVDGAGTLDRTVELFRAVADTEILAVYLDVPITQNISPEEGGNFPAATNEFVLDKLTYICQMLSERVGRSLQVSIDTPFNGILPELAPNRTFKINEDGDGLVLSKYDPDLAGSYVDIAESAIEEAIEIKDATQEIKNEVDEIYDKTVGILEVAQDGLLFGFTPLYFNLEDWQQNNNLYELVFNEIPFINGVFRKVVDTYERVINIDQVEVLEGTKLIAQVPFEGYALKTAQLPIQTMVTQDAESDIWSITHNLHRYPCVTCIDTAGTAMVGTVVYTSLNAIEIHFENPVAGKAILT